MRIYGDSISGNCLKVKYVADRLGLRYEWIETSVLSGDTRTAEFLALNPAGQVPVVDFGSGRILSQSNAIMRHLARGSELIPEDVWLAAKMDEWLFWEQYSHEPAVAVLRFKLKYQQTPIAAIDPMLIKKGDAALDLMEQHLSKHEWMVGGQLSLADIALKAYTQFAEDGGLSLANRPQIGRWLNQVASEIGA
ncbi:glutathione S-transferase family protein [Kordiimonas sp.]|uniref:glutathione S-transferase family protein n=1 Tax=Kordiimonas sp. TaxID=1970157 RepID=UPI003A8DD511